MELYNIGEIEFPIGGSSDVLSTIPPAPEAPERKLPPIHQLPQRLLYFLHTTVPIIKFNRQPVEIHPLGFLIPSALERLDQAFLPRTRLSSFPKPSPREFLSFPDQLVGEPEEDEDDDLKDQALTAAWNDNAVGGKGVPVFFHGHARIEYPEVEEGEKSMLAQRGDL